MLLWLTYCRKTDGKERNESFTKIEELINRKNILINEFDYLKCEIRLSIQYFKN